MTQLHSSTDDPGEALRILRSLFHAPMELTADPGSDFALRATASVDDGFTFADLTLGFGGRGRTESTSTFVAGVTVLGEHRWDLDGRTGDASEPLVIAPQHAANGTFDHIRTYSVAVPAAAVDEVAAVWRTSGVPVVAADGARRPLEALLRHLGETSAVFPTLFDEPLIRTSAQQAVIHALIASSPSADPAAATEQAGPRALLRALAFIDEHAGDPVTTAEIAAAARMSVRGLQSMFQRELGTTPVARLRRVRLDRVHAELLAAEPYDGVSVASTARRWGFVHLPRFASAYREAYGELPSQTLRR